MKRYFHFFYGGVLSNFYPCKIIYENQVFNSSEQLFMYLKALHFKDFDIAKKIAESITPKEAKSLGRLVAGFDSAQWDDTRYDIMFRVLHYKAEYCKEFKQLLLDTENKILVEASPYDRIWGIGYNKDTCFLPENINGWGQNLLGKCLMELRNELIKFGIKK